MADDTPTTSPTFSTSATSHLRFWLLAVVTLATPLGGLIGGLIFLSKSDPADKRLGKAILIFTAVVFVVYFLLLLIVSTFA